MSMHTVPREIRHTRSLRNTWVLYLMFVPALVWMVCFKLLPIPGLLIAFQNYNIFDGFFGSPWVGLKHFEQLFRRKQFVSVIFNTLEISLLKLVILFPIPILLALLLNEFRSRRCQRVAQSVIYMPHFLSFVGECPKNP